MRLLLWQRWGLRRPEKADDGRVGQTNYRLLVCPGGQGCGRVQDRFFRRGALDEQAGADVLRRLY
ncbi:hypothetical protein D1872_284150 [compost metagenome]